MPIFPFAFAKLIFPVSNPLSEHLLGLADVSMTTSLLSCLACLCGSDHHHHISSKLLDVAFAVAFAFVVSFPGLLNRGKEFFSRGSIFVLLLALSFSCEKMCTKLPVALDELGFVSIDTSTSSKYLMIAVRSSENVLQDLPRSTPASPKMVSEMIDFSARMVASSSTLLAHLISKSATPVPKLESWLLQPAVSSASLVSFNSDSTVCHQRVRDRPVCACLDPSD